MYIETVLCTAVIALALIALAAIMTAYSHTHSCGCRHPSDDGAGE